MSDALKSEYYKVKAQAYYKFLKDSTKKKKKSYISPKKQGQSIILGKNLQESIILNKSAKNDVIKRVSKTIKVDSNQMSSVESETEKTLNIKILFIN